MLNQRPVLLLVDDEPAILEILCVLFENDFEIFAFSDPGEALERIKCGAAPDFLISDLVMPGMNGIELFLEARKNCPDLPGIILTGNGGSPLLKQISILPRVQVALKPFDLKVLVRMVGLGRISDRVHEKNEAGQGDPECREPEF